MIRQVFVEFGAPKKGTVYSDPTTDDLFGLFRDKNAALFVALEEGRIAGCCGIYPTHGLPEGCTELVKYYLPAEARGKGIGKALLGKSVEAALNLGYTSLYLESLPHFSRALGIYKRMGFQKLLAPLGASGHNGCTIWMNKTLI